MKFAAILATLALLGSPLRAQAPPVKPGSVEGTVTNSVTGESVKNANLILENTSAGSNILPSVPMTTISDAAGHFHFDNVPPGSYRISAQHDSFIAKRGWWQPSPALTVAEEQHVQDVTVQLVPMGVVAGHVLDEDGDPIVGARVTILQYSYLPGRKRLTALAQVESNDLGEFEAVDLAPGRYYFQVMGPQPRNIPRQTRWAHGEEAFPTTFYPNAREIGQATATDVAPGAHLNNIDFRLRKMPAYHIRGTVVGQSGGQAGTYTALTVNTPGVQFGAIMRSDLQPDGSFDVRGVVDGSYRLSYEQSTPSKGIAYASQEVHVADADVNAVVFAQKAGLTLSGTVTMEDPQPKTLRMRINLSPIEGYGGETCAVGPDGRFTIADVQPQMWQLEILNGDSGKYVKSIRFGDREIKDGEIDLTAGASAPLNIVLGADGAEVDGNVQTADGQPAAAAEITLAPAEEYNGRADLLKRASTDAYGNFHDQRCRTRRLPGFCLGKRSGPHQHSIRGIPEALREQKHRGDRRAKRQSFGSIERHQRGRHREGAKPVAMISILIAAAFLAQQVAATAPAGTRVSGRAINSLNAEPVPKVTVILRAQDVEHGFSYADETDGDGHFSIDDVEPGEYGIVVERAGFAIRWTGAAGAPGPNVKVDAGREVTNLNIPLTPLGVIAGRILDANGDPVRDELVDAVQFKYSSGKKELKTVAEVRTRDNGDFRLFGLEAGTYYLKASGIRRPNSGTYMHETAPIYYPGASDESRAAPIELRAGAQLKDFDVRLQATGTYTIRFKLTEADGPTFSRVQAQLLDADGLVPTFGGASAAGLSFGAIPPGSYDAVFTRVVGGEKRSYAVQHVEVVNADVDGGTLTFLPGVEFDWFGSYRRKGAQQPWEAPA